MRWREYLSFARRERNGIIMLTLLILATALMPRFFPSGAIRYAPAEGGPPEGNLVSGYGATASADDRDKKWDRERRVDFAGTGFKGSAVTGAGFEKTGFRETGFREGFKKAGFKETGFRETGFARKPGYRGKSGYSRLPGYSGYPAEDNSGKQQHTDLQPDLPLFRFDPNTLSADEWKKLGLGDRVIATIQRYTAKGGRFYQPQDLGKIYGLSKADYERLAPYATIPKPGSRAQKANRSQFPAFRQNPDITPLSGQDPGKTDPRYPQDIEERGGLTGMDGRETRGLAGRDVHETRGLSERDGRETGSRAEGRWKSTVREADIIIDINKADTGLLQRLPGIGSVLAARIVLFRKKLGGFSNLSQLCEVYGLSEEVYLRIVGSLSCDPALIKRVNINAEELYPLRSHPYMKGYIAQTIINYRKQHGPFDSIAELKKINNITPETLEKMLPYLSVR